MVRRHSTDVWKSIIMVSGELFVTTTLTPSMLESLATVLVLGKLLGEMSKFRVCCVPDFYG